MLSSSPVYGGCKHLWNFGQFLRDYMAQHPRRQLFSYSQPWEPEVSLRYISTWGWRKLQNHYVECRRQVNWRGKYIHSHRADWCNGNITFVFRRYSFWISTILPDIFTEACRAISVSPAEAVTYLEIKKYDRPDGGGSEDLWNVGKLLPDYTALQPRR
jgi:hypothetical protein